MESGLFLRICRYTCIALAISAAAPSAFGEPALYFRLAFEASSSIPAPIREAAVAEAARIWSPYGVLVGAGDNAPSDAVIAPLAIATDLTRDVSDRVSDDGDLGSVEFNAEGLPGSTITVYYGTIVRLAAGTEVMGVSASAWPAALRDEVIARALGRVLAHEIGHIALHSPHHPATGLMRARQQAWALADPDGRLFELTDFDRARLRIVVASLLPPPQKLAGGAGDDDGDARPSTSVNTISR